MRKNESWLLLLHQIPPKSDSFRVKIWRGLQRVGALQLKNSAYILPYSDENKTKFAGFISEINAANGDAFLCNSEFVMGIDQQEIISLFNKDRTERYEVITEELQILRKIVSTKKKPSENELMATQHSLGKLERQAKEIIAIDFFHSDAREPTLNLLNRISSKVDKLRGHSVTETVKQSKVKDFQGRTWVTRTDVHVDRLACAWLIGKFIDKKAKYKFVQGNEYKPLKNEVRFDMFNGEFTHVGDKCSFEVLAESFSLNSEPIKVISEIIHDIDIKDNKYQHSETLGISQIIRGIVQRYSSDEARLGAAAEVFENIYLGFKTK